MRWDRHAPTGLAMTNTIMFDLIIIGASAAGCAGAVYAARRELNLKIITDNIGGEVALSGEIGNWPGIINIQGFELAQKFAAHVKSYNVPTDEGLKVTIIEKTGNFFVVTAQNATGQTKTYEAKAVIVATGIHPRQLGVPGEKELFHKGVTYCTVCDGPLYKNKITVTIGSGNAALESALMMGKLAKKVYLLSKYPNTKEQNGGFPKGENILIDNGFKVVDIWFNQYVWIKIDAGEKINYEKQMKYLDDNRGK